MLKIIFIEDDPDQIMLYDAKFNMEGILMMTASNGQAAMALAKSERPDLILLDLLLRNENGMDIFEKLREDADTKNLPVLVFTNFDKKEFRQRAAELGAVDYIIKAQVTPTELVKKIREFMAQKAL